MQQQRAKKWLQPRWMLHIITTGCVSENKEVEKWVRLNTEMNTVLKWDNDKCKNLLGNHMWWFDKHQSRLDMLDIYRYAILYVYGGIVVTTVDPPIENLVEMTSYKMAAYKAKHGNAWVLNRSPVSSVPMQKLWIDLLNVHSPPAPLYPSAASDWNLSYAVKNAWASVTELRALDSSVQDTHHPYLLLSYEQPKILVAILARNKAHVLPTFLRCLDLQDYPKDRIHLYVHTNNNYDCTAFILRTWIEKKKCLYAGVTFIDEDDPILQNDRTEAHEWKNNRTGLDVLARIRQASLHSTLETGSDYYFVADCDNFLLPHVISHLVACRKDVVGPMLHCIGHSGFSNFFDYSAIEPISDPSYVEKVHLITRAVHCVDVVHCTYLVRASVIHKLSYIGHETGSWEFLNFSLSAKDSGVCQYIDNTRLHGVFLQFWSSVNREVEVIQKFSGALNDVMKAMMTCNSPEEFQRSIIHMLQRFNVDVC